jgi:hypothetical protein
MNVDIELSQLKMMRSPAGESFRFKLLLEVALWLCLMVLIGVIILTSSMEISIVTGLVLSAFFGAVLGGLFIARQLLIVINHQSKYVDSNKVAERIDQIKT